MQTSSSTVVDILLKKKGSLVGPATCDIADSVTTSTKHKEGKPEALYKFDAGAMALEGEVEATETITRQRVGTALKHHCARTIPVHHFLDDGLENVLVALIVNAIPQWKIHGIVLALARSYVLLSCVQEDVRRTQPAAWKCIIVTDLP